MSTDLNSILHVNDSGLVPIELLDFDVNNPRFTPDKRPDNNTDVAVISILASSADLSELIQSISASGYINIEPLIVIERNNRFAVLEGNRRLAAVKALRDAELARAAKISVPIMTESRRSTLDRLLAYRVATEDDARDLIGFKHINGPQAWDAFAKARFAARWLDDQQQKKIDKQPNLSLSDIAGRMGDQHLTIHRMVTAFYVLEQAEKIKAYSIQDRKKKSFSFSHLYTGLAYEEFTDYIGMPRPDRTADPSRDPVPVDRTKELRQLLIWLYGSRDEDLDPVVKSQNPDLTRLRHVLGSQPAIAMLVARGSLDDAIVTATPASQRFQVHLLTANAELQHAVSTLDGFDPATQPEMLQIAESALKRARLIKIQIDASLEYNSKEEAGDGSQSS